MRSATQKKNHVHDFEYGIINLNNDSDAGTHWTPYYKGGPEAIYFDNFGNIRSPLELLKYQNCCHINKSDRHILQSLQQNSNTVRRANTVEDVMKKAV